MKYLLLLALLALSGCNECEHDWTKWQDAKDVTAHGTILGVESGEYPVQVRECKKCGLKEIHILRP